MVEPATAGPLATLVVVKSALVPTGVTTVTVLLGVGSGVVLVPTAVLVMLPVEAVTLALTTRVRVWPRAKLAVVAPTLPPTAAPVAVVWLELALIRLKPALKMSVMVTCWAVLGPKLTTVTV